MSASTPHSRLAPHIFLGSEGNDTNYEVSLHNPLSDPVPSWRFKTERWERAKQILASRGPAMRESLDPERGLAALRAVELPKDHPAVHFLRTLQDYVVFCPTTPVLRGVAPETQPHRPVGLSGGQLPDAVGQLLRSRPQNDHALQVCREALGLIDWARSFGAASADSMLLSTAAAASPRVIRFTDKYMIESRSVLSGYDASEGALYVLFLAVLAAHERTPALFAVDNADHGLNPRLARALMEHFCKWLLASERRRQILLTTHSPLALDGLPLQDDRVRLFTVSRTSSGRTSIRRITVDDSILAKAREGWTLSRLWVMGHLGGVPNV
jgi:hypothetical protein